MELVMVLILIGIIAVFAAPRMPDITSTNADAFKDKLRADIRYAQNLAMSRNQRCRVYFNTAPSPVPDGYAVVNDLDGDAIWGEAGEFAMDPAGTGNLSVVLNTGDYSNITISTGACVPAVGGFTEFNSLGVSTTGGGAITVCANGVAVGAVVIAAETGAVN